MKKMVAAMLAVLSLAVLAIGCGGTATEQGGTDGQSVQMTVAGSTSVSPLMEAFKEDFESKNEGWTINVQSNGSSVGIQSAIDGTADIGMSSRDLKEEETAEGLVPTKIAIDGIAVVVNPANGVSDLTSEQIRQIFMGEITNWSEVGGNDAEIVVVSREEGSGTRDGFEEIMKVQKTVDNNGEQETVSGVVETAITVDATGAVKSTVAGNENAIGYISMGVLDDSVKAVKVDGVEATVDNVKSETYKVFRYFLVVTKGEPEGNAKTFIDYMLSEEGQKIVTDDHYISVN